MGQAGVDLARGHDCVTIAGQDWHPMKPLIGISCCIKAFGIFATPNHAASDTYIRAVDLVMGGLPMLIPAMGQAGDPAAFAARIDGLLLTGSRSNVQPGYYHGQIGRAHV